MLPVQFSAIFVLFCWLIISVEECKSAVVFLKLSSAMMEESADGDTDIMEDEEIKNQKDYCGQISIFQPLQGDLK